jgi:cytochrome c553
MNKLLIGFFGCMFFAQAYAQAPTTEAPKPQVPKLAATCTACHGVEGVSTNTLWPNLAGQQPDYLFKEMKAFRDGTRVEPSMPATLLQGASDQDLADLASYYSGLLAAVPAAVENTKPGQHVRARCVSCHGMNGITVSSIWANLAGQKEGYLKKQLLDYKSGRREHPIMQVIAGELSDQQIADVAKYYNQH